MPTDLAHVYWIGGSPCSGKSSIATLLIEHGPATLYDCDTAFDAHQRRATPDAQPRLHRLTGLDWDAIWLRPVSELVQDELAIYGEEFGLILADLRALPFDRPILAVGAALLPELVALHLADPCQAIWVVPTGAFQRHHYARRPWIKDILAGCSQPEQAFANWMDRDEAFAQHVLRTARARGLATLVVDGQISIEDNAATIAAQFGWT
jgi:hypothetical protein